MEKLSLISPSFRKIIQGNYIYADKTEYIHKMIENFDSCFLSRPRRFGKTLLLDTIAELFKGDRELFKGLWIEAKSGYSFENHPVLKISMGDYTEISSKDDLVDGIKTDLTFAADNEHIKITARKIGQMLKQFLNRLSDKHGATAVILIDECDAPVSRYIADQALAADNRDVLHDFYAALKGSYEYVHLAVVTGITRFALTSMDSGPNNFVDISLLPEFSGVCGFTIPEFLKLFRDRFRDTLQNLKCNGSIGQNAGLKELKRKILAWYDGYNWLGKFRVLNPYSILNFFKHLEFDSFWPLSGQPSHLTALVRERPLDFIQPSLDGYLSEDVKKADIGKLEAVPVLFHSGYLTIDKKSLVDSSAKTAEGDTVQVVSFTFRPPNLDVELSYNSTCFKDLFERDGKYFNKFSIDMKNAIPKKDCETVSHMLEGLLTGITHRQRKPEEAYYHSLFQAAFIAAGIEVLGEPAGSRGQADMAVFLDGRIRVVIELKYRKADDLNDKSDGVRAEKELSAALDEAEKAIRDKRYDWIFRFSANEIIPMALAVCGRDRVTARFIESQATVIPTDP
ncbi:MAG: ATP-binding protein [Deltaproteobacteria bacterium]|jgi:hypothetical protein|nr:ATP-binding protein [Deltaproteobacteria bacterium]